MNAPRPRGPPRYLSLAGPDGSALGEAPGDGLVSSTRLPLPLELPHPQHGELHRS